MIPKSKIPEFPQSFSYGCIIAVLSLLQAMSRIVRDTALTLSTPALSVASCTVRNFVPSHVLPYVFLHEMKHGVDPEDTLRYRIIGLFWPGFLFVPPYSCQESLHAVALHAFFNCLHMMEGATFGIIRRYALGLFCFSDFRNYAVQFPLF